MKLRLPVTLFAAAICLVQASAASAPHVHLYGYSLYNKAIETHGYVKMYLDNPTENELIQACCEGRDYGLFAAGSVDGIIYGFEYVMPDVNSPQHTDIVAYDINFGTRKSIGSWADQKWKNLQPGDMSYDYTTGTMYLIAYDYGSALYTVDLENGEIRKVVDIKEDPFALAVSPKGCFTS